MLSIDCTRTTEATPSYLRISVASHSKRSSLTDEFGSKYPEFPSGTVPYRCSLRHTSTLLLARLPGSVKVSRSHAVWLCRTAISIVCYDYNYLSVKSLEGSRYPSLNRLR